MIEKYEFTDDLLIGNEVIDDEHRSLFELINTVVEADEKNEIPKTELLESMLKQLDYYATNHFIHEEQYMEQIDDPELSLQKKEHMAFVNYVEEESEKEISEENAAERIKEIIAFGASWLYYHIMGSDNMIGAFRKSDIDQSADPFVYRNEFITGITFMDDGNKELFGILYEVKELINSKEEQDSFDDVMKLFTKLLDAATTLVSAKESYMERIGYSGIDVQRRAHQLFLKKISRIDVEHIKEDRKEYMEEFVLYISNLLSVHIVNEDKKIPKT